MPLWRSRLIVVCLSHFEVLICCSTVESHVIRTYRRRTSCSCCVMNHPELDDIYNAYCETTACAANLFHFHVSFKRIAPPVLLWTRPHCRCSALRPEKSAVLQALETGSRAILPFPICGFRRVYKMREKEMEKGSKLA